MNHAKFDALVHYICARCNDPSRLGATKLNKVLWYADVWAFAEHGTSISGTRYIKRQFGPVPQDITGARLRLSASGAIVERQAQTYQYDQTQFISLRKADVSMFTAAEISIVDQVIEFICTHHTASSISNLSHDVIWQSAEIGEVIPLAAAAFGGHFAEIDEDDLRWAHEEIDKLAAVSASP